MNLDFLERYAARPLTASDADAILNLCAENEQFYRYHPPLATKESVLEDLSALPPGKSAARFPVEKAEVVLVRRTLPGRQRRKIL